MRSDLRTLVFATVVAAGASGILGASARAVGDEWGLYSNGAPAVRQGSGRGRSAGYSGRQMTYQLPAPSPIAVTSYWYYEPQPVYQLPAPSPAAVAGYWYYYPQPIYQPPASNPPAVAGYWYFYPVRR